MNKHYIYPEFLEMIENDIPVLLESESGTGKTTMVMQAAEDLKLNFFTDSLTKQTSISNLKGFTDIHGVYSKTQLRDAFEFGGIYLLDELDSGDANTLLVLNTIENGYISFPDKVVKKHKDFRLVATCNPLNEHNSYTGRSKLDQSTLDRFVILKIHRDDELEKAMLNESTHIEVNIYRKLLIERGITKDISMRSALYYQRLKNIGIKEAEKKTLLRGIEEQDEIIKHFNSKKPKEVVKTMDDLIDYLNNKDTKCTLQI